MNARMYRNAAVQENLSTLARRGVRVVEPSAGALACGEEGPGRMPEPVEIAEEIFRALAPVHDLQGVHVLVTAGPTHEYLDPVRYISNPSTGRMGLAMARAAWYYSDRKSENRRSDLRCDQYGYGQISECKHYAGIT